MTNMTPAIAPATLRETTAAESLAVSGGGVNHYFPGPYGAGSGRRTPSATYGVPVAPPIPSAPSPAVPPTWLNRLPWR